MEVVHASEGALVEEGVREGHRHSFTPHFSSLTHVTVKTQSSHCYSDCSSSQATSHNMSDDENEVSLAS